MILMASVSFTFSQTVVSGMISDAKTKEPLVGISVQIKGKVIGTISDIKGKFQFTTSTPPPFQLVISSVGYKTQEYTVKAENAAINISLEDQDVMGQEVVVSASRVEESVMKSAVTVEKLDLRAIKESPSHSFYDALSNIKGVDMTTQGLLFKSINMRGFGSTGNVRTVQMIDGMDNQAPGLNFAVDNIVGMPELDVESVELLPGASSALYGPNALNGVVLMNSKSPFLYQGLSSSIKTGIMSASNRDNVNTPFYDLSIRYAKAFNNKFAFKLNLSYLGAQDWEASSKVNLNKGGIENGSRGLGVNSDYDGVNIYGDEVQTNIGGVADQLVGLGVIPAAARGLVPNIAVSRTGYNEKDLMDYNTKSFKLNAGLHYRLTEKMELIGQVNYGAGTTVYTGTGRYGLRDFNITQAKLELRGDNFTVRTYTTQERSGKSYLAGLAAIGILNEAKGGAMGNTLGHQTWFGEYVGALVQARAGGASLEQAQIAARTYADRDIPQPGSEKFNTLLDKYRDTPISKGGSNFQDETNLYHAEGFYNFKNQIKFLDLQVGANVRQYQLRSNGTLFSDQKEGRNGTIPINEFGAFVQAGKNLFGDHLKLTGSIRYDKNQNFEGQFSPRISAVTTFGQNNIRLSLQKGFRIPTTQNQYIDLTTPQGTLIGGLSEFDTRYNLSAGIPRHILTDFQVDTKKNGAASKYFTDQVKSLALQTATALVNSNLSKIQAGVIAIVQANVTSQVTTVVNGLVAAGLLPAANAPAAIATEVATRMGSDAVKGIIAENVKATVTSEIGKGVASLLPVFALDALPKYKAVPLRPETIVSWEIGYKTLIAKKLFLDAYYYQSTYKDFLGGTVIVVPTAPAQPGLPLSSGIGVGKLAGYSRVANTSEEITSRGWAIGLDYGLGKGYNIGGNIANNELVNFVPTAEQQYAGYNTPQYRFNLSFGRNLGSGTKIGYKLTFKHQNSFLWESSFVLPTSTEVGIFQNTTVPAINNLDAQVSFKVPTIKSVIKVGGTNIGGNPYIQAFGSAMVGSMYYVSVSFDELFNR